MLCNVMQLWYGLSAFIKLANDSVYDVQDLRKDGALILKAISMVWALCTYWFIDCL